MAGLRGVPGLADPARLSMSRWSARSKNVEEYSRLSAVYAPSLTFSRCGGGRLPFLADGAWLGAERSLCSSPEGARKESWRAESRVVVSQFCRVLRSQSAVARYGEPGSASLGHLRRFSSYKSKPGSSLD